jgi:hypothetical protein
VAEISPDDLRRLLLENADLSERLEQAEEKARALQQKLDQLQVTFGSADLAAEPDPVLGPEEAASLVARLVESVSSQFEGLAVRDGELRLNVAFEKSGQKEGFVIPTADSPPEVRENLHSVSFRLGPRID